MLINQNKKGALLLKPEGSLRSSYSYQRSQQLTTTGNSANSKGRFFTEREGDEDGFGEYEAGKKILGDLPEIKLTRLKNRPTLFNHLFNFVSTGKHKNLTNPKPTNPTQREREKQFISRLPRQFNSPISQNRSVYTQFLKRKNSDHTQNEGINRGYSICIPDLSLEEEEKPDYFRIIKRKPSKAKQSKLTRLKTQKMRTQSNNEDPAISELIKIQKMDISRTKEAKTIMNRAKIFNFERKSHHPNRIINSRIQPWGLNFNPLDTDSF